MSHNFLLLDAANIRTEDVPKYLDPIKLSPFRVFAQSSEGQLCCGSIFPAYEPQCLVGVSFGALFDYAIINDFPSS